MALTLDSPILAARQDEQSRTGLLCEIISSQFTPDIPFDGTFLTTETTNEQKPNWITLLSGRLCGIYTFGTTAFKYVYTDVDRTQKYSVTISLGVGLIAIEASLCELTNGNIGVIYIADYVDGTHKLYRLVLSPIGAVVSAATLIASYASANILGSPFVIRLASGTFLLVYTMIDSPDYKIMMRTGTTANFLTWSAESECSIAGLTSTRKRYNTYLSQLSTGEIFLWFDYEDDVSGDLERYNIFYSIFNEGGSTWSAAAPATDYDTFGDVAKHPVVVHKATNQATLAYTEQRGAIQMDATAVGICFDTLNPTDLILDAINQKLYVLSTYAQTGTKKLYGVLKIDIATWTIDKCWSDTSTPAFNGAFFNNHISPDRHHGERYLIPVGITETGAPFRMISVVDGQANTITNYAFDTDPTYGAVKNVDLTLGTYDVLKSTWIDFASKKLWCMFVDQISASHSVRIGWIDLTEVLNPGDPASLYHWNALIFENDWDQYELMADPTLLILPDQDFIVVSFGSENTGATWPGHLKVYEMSSGGLYKNYKHSLFEDFPFHGLRRVKCKNGKLYGGFTYEATMGEADKRGLCEIDIVSDAMTLHRPSWATVDDYKLMNIYASSDGRLFITTGGYGITIYNIATDTWSIPFTNTTLPGLSPGNAYESYGPILYDETTGLIYTAPTQPGTTEWVGVICFSAYGYIRRSYYMTGTYAGGIWTFLPAVQLVQGLEDYDLVMALDTDTAKSIWAFWTNQTLLELSIKWDKENSSFDLSPYIVKGQDITLSKTIRGDPNSLSFSVIKGDLFDPTNEDSIMAMYLKKGRKLNLKFGETIEGDKYLQQQGVFMITDLGPVKYKKKEYPILKIEAQDKRAKWKEKSVITDSYGTDPVSILIDLLQDHANQELSDIVLPSFENSVVLWFQWIEVNLQQILDQLCRRFGYYMRITIDDKISARKISDQNPIDHVYGDLSKIEDLSIDTKYSDLTNQIIVTGQSHDWIEVLFAEESVGQQVTGSTGWWGKSKLIYVWYSDDHQRRCRYPRMEVKQSVKDGPYLCDFGTEYVYSVREDETGLVVRVIEVNLTAQVISTLILYFILMIVCGALSWIPFVSLGCAVAQANTMFNLMTALNSVTMYSYNFYAQPVGYVRQSFQSDPPWKDVEFQQMIGDEISKTINDPLCFSQQQCQTVTNFEGMITKLERAGRLLFNKVADLRDEEGDSIQVIHPKSRKPVRLFVTDLTRKMKIPESPEAEGYFRDTIEGWKIP